MTSHNDTHEQMLIQWHHRYYTETRGLWR